MCDKPDFLHLGSLRLEFRLEIFGGAGSTTVVQPLGWIGSEGLTFTES